MGTQCTMSNLLAADGSPSGYLKYEPLCPESNGHYQINSIGSDPQCDCGVASHSLRALAGPNGGL
jgi:hypothetical protein